jgi:RNA polymerase sigma-70 factor (ECF subfamily)
MSVATTQLNDRSELERQLEVHRVELTGYCYRMLGSPFEAEDAVQETLLRAWRALDRFEGRSSLRSWLFGIATNVCFDHLNAGRRRALPMDLSPPSPADAPLGAALPEHLWIGPVTEGRVLPQSTDPAEVAVTRESIRLAFVAALQHLTPRQRAVLILRDVLRWRADEVADLLGATTTSVHSVLRRARSVLAEADPGRSQRLHASDEDARALVDRYVDAFERFDVDALVALLHEDVTFSMPPYLLWMRGATAVREWFAAAPTRCADVRFVAIPANASPAFAMYRRDRPDAAYEPFGVQVIELSANRIVRIDSFLDAQLFPLLGLAAHFVP